MLTHIFSIGLSPMFQSWASKAIQSQTLFPQFFLSVPSVNIFPARRKTRNTDDCLRMSDPFGLLFRHQVLLDSKVYLGRECTSDNLEWTGNTNGEHLSLCDSSIENTSIAPVSLSFVAVATVKEWHIKLSGAGDYNEAFPKKFSKLKWLVHFQPPLNTIFMNDWHTGIAVLSRLQDRLCHGDGKDMLISRDSGGVELRTTASMFREKVCIHHMLTKHAEACASILKQWTMFL